MGNGRFLSIFENGFLAVRINAAEQHSLGTG